MHVQRRTAAPILRWAGGKRWLLSYLEAVCRVWAPTAFYEPFVGGAAVYFAFQWPNATINDVNDELIATYRAVAHSPSEVGEGLSGLAVSREQYEKLRHSAPTDDVGRAVRFLYLNRCGYGGIYRINKSGVFNVPYSGDRGIASLWANERLTRLSGALNGTNIVCGDFEQVLAEVEAGAFVYCDPVYVLPDTGGSFARYSYPKFAWDDLERLADVVHELRARGALVAVSAPAHPSVTRLFRSAVKIEFARRAPLPTARGQALTEVLYVLGDRATQRVIGRQMEMLR